MSDALAITEAALCIERIVAFKAERGLSDVALVKHLPMLGSARTWSTRLAVSNWAEAPLDAWLPALRRAVAVIEGTPVVPRVLADALDLFTPLNRHLAEADRCRAEGFFQLALGHCAAARRELASVSARLSTLQTATP
jgi:hypothetical protein